MLSVKNSEGCVLQYVRLTFWNYQTCGPKTQTVSPNGKREPTQMSSSKGASLRRLVLRLRPASLIPLVFMFMFMFMHQRRGVILIFKSVVNYRTSLSV
jgi:hypothetical protein